jgi:hypothetical protein
VAASASPAVDVLLWPTQAGSVSALNATERVGASPLKWAVLHYAINTDAQFHVTMTRSGAVYAAHAVKLAAGDLMTFSFTYETVDKPGVTVSSERFSYRSPSLSTVQDLPILGAGSNTGTGGSLPSDACMQCFVGCPTAVTAAPTASTPTPAQQCWSACCPGQDEAKMVAFINSIVLLNPSTTAAAQPTAAFAAAALPSLPTVTSPLGVFGRNRRAHVLEATGVANSLNIGDMVNNLLHGLAAPFSSSVTTGTAATAAPAAAATTASAALTNAPAALASAASGTGAAAPAATAATTAATTATSPLMQNGFLNLRGLTNALNNPAQATGSLGQLPLFGGLANLTNTRGVGGTFLDAAANPFEGVNATDLTTVLQQLSNATAIEQLGTGIGNAINNVFLGIGGASTSTAPATGVGIIGGGGASPVGVGTGVLPRLFSAPRKQQFKIAAALDSLFGFALPTTTSSTAPAATTTTTPQVAGGLHSQLNALASGFTNGATGLNNAASQISGGLTNAGAAPTALSQQLSSAANPLAAGLQNAAAGLGTAPTSLDTLGAGLSSLFGANAGGVGTVANSLTNGLAGGLNGAAAVSNLNQAAEAAASNFASLTGAATGAGSLGSGLNSLAQTVNSNLGNLGNLGANSGSVTSQLNAAATAAANNLAGLGGATSGAAGGTNIFAGLNQALSSAANNVANGLGTGTGLLPGFPAPTTGASTTGNAFTDAVRNAAAALLGDGTVTAATPFNLIIPLPTAGSGTPSTGTPASAGNPVGGNNVNVFRTLQSNLPTLASGLGATGTSTSTNSGASSSSAAAAAAANNAAAAASTTGTPAAGGSLIDSLLQPVSGLTNLLTGNNAGGLTGPLQSITNSSFAPSQMLSSFGSFPDQINGLLCLNSACYASCLGGLEDMIGGLVKTGEEMGLDQLPGPTLPQFGTAIKGPTLPTGPVTDPAAVSSLLPNINSLPALPRLPQLTPQNAQAMMPLLQAGMSSASGAGINAAQSLSSGASCMNTCRIACSAGQTMTGEQACATGDTLTCLAGSIGDSMSTVSGSASGLGAAVQHAENNLPSLLPSNLANLNFSSILPFSAGPGRRHVKTQQLADFFELTRNAIAGITGGAAGGTQGDFLSPLTQLFGVPLAATNTAKTSSTSSSTSSGSTAQKFVPFTTFSSVFDGLNAEQANVAGTFVQGLVDTTSSAISSAVPMETFRVQNADLFKLVDTSAGSDTAARTILSRFSETANAIAKPTNGIFAPGTTVLAGLSGLSDILGY